MRQAYIKSSRQLTKALGLLVLVVLFLSACTNTSGTSSASASSATTSSSASASVSPTSSATPITKCPAALKANPAAMPTMTLGTKAQQLVYFTNSGSIDTPATAFLKRYDVSTGTTTTIITLPATWIQDAQLSKDGKWILFTDMLQGRSTIQLVRIDGQALQTLYCSSTNSSVKSLVFAGSSSTQWSPDQQHLVFVAGPDMGSPTVYLLTLNTGNLDILLKPRSNLLGYLPRTWIDNTRIYLTGMIPNSDAPETNLYMLDSKNGLSQSDTNLQLVLKTTNMLCWDFDSTYDATQMFFNQCEQKAGSLGTGRIEQHTLSGATVKTVLDSHELAITHVRSVGYKNANKLLFSVYNNGMGVGFDQSKDGLWIINSDGTGLKRLSPSPNVDLNHFGQYPWSNVSRDGNSYSVGGEGIFYGSLTGADSTPKKVASGGNGIDALALVGWTTF